MKVMITVAVWGQDYVQTFCNYSLASQLAPGNLPALASSATITYHVITTARDARIMRKNPIVQAAKEYCKFDWDLIEDNGYSTDSLPTGPEGVKYSFLSLLQNIAITRSLDHDALVFNYADFIWCDGSLKYSIDRLTQGEEAVLSFCIPVDKQKGVEELNRVRRASGSGSPALTVTPRHGADIAIRNMHREAKLRYWDDPAFTITPTYLFWPVDGEGLVARAYHHTVLALRVRPEEEAFREGIPGGSLDGYFTATLAKTGKYVHALTSDDAMVFSLYDTIVETHIGGPSRQVWDDYDRFASMRDCLRGIVTPGQRDFALVSIEIRRRYDSPDKWEEVKRESRQILEDLHARIAYDQEEYDRIRLNDVSLEEVAERWRTTSETTLARRKGVGQSLARSVSRLRSLAARVAAFGRASVVDEVRGLPGRVLARLRRLALARSRVRAEGHAVALENEPSISEVKELLCRNDTKALIDRIVPFVAEHQLVPTVTISRRAAAMSRIAHLTEQLLPSLRVPTETEPALAAAESVMRSLVKELPLWPEAHRFLARNLWFQSRFEEALAAFADADRAMADLARAAGDEPGRRVYLPRNCGHVIGLMGHIDAFVKHRLLTGDTRPYHLSVPLHEVVNTAFLDYWRDHLVVKTPTPARDNPRYEEAYCTVNWNWVMPDDAGGIVHVHKAIARIQRQWAARDGKPLLSLKSDHRARMRSILAKLGLSADDWYVCLHVRSAGFYDEDEHTAQHFRNSPIEDYYDLMRFIASRGGWVIRMGDHTTPPLDLGALGDARHKVVDWAHSGDRSAELDVALCAQCRLFVSSPSGLHTVARAFGRPACYVNYPIYAGFPWHPGEVLLPQRYYSYRSEKFLSLSDILGTKLVHADHQFMLERAGVTLVRNEPEDIVETVKEALDQARYQLPQRTGRSDALSASTAEQVCEEFDRLNRQHEVDISGTLSRFYAAKYANELCPPTSQT